MCKKLNVEQSTISGYETKASGLKFNTLQKIADALECNVPFLVDIDSNIYDYEVWKLGPH